MIDQLQDALKKGGLRGLAAELNRVEAATRTAATAQTRFATAVNTTASLRARTVELTRTQALMQVQGRLLRDQITQEARLKSVRAGDYARVNAAQQAMEMRKREVDRAEELVRVQGRLQSVRSGAFAADDNAARALDLEKQRVQAFEDMARLANRMKEAKSGQFAVAASDKQSVSLQAQKVALAERESLVKEGVYAEGLKGQAALQREQRKIEEMEKRAAYEAKMGRRLGGAAYHAERAARNPMMQAAAGAAGGAGAAVVGSAIHGFQGTVEWNQFNLQVQMVSREMAGALLPALQWVTKGFGVLRGWMEKMTPQMQNMLMLASLAGGGALLGRRLGVGAALMAGGGIARGAVALGAGALGLGGAGAAAGGAAATAGAGGLMARGGRLLTRLPIAAVAAGAARDQFSKESYYGLYRNAGYDKVRSFIGGTISSMSEAVFHDGNNRAKRQEWRAKQERDVMGYTPGAKFTNVPGYGTITERSNRKPGETAAQAQQRRLPTIAAAGFESSGSAFERITNQLALTATGAKEETTESLLKDIWDFMVTTFGGEEAPRLEQRS